MFDSDEQISEADLIKHLRDMKLTAMNPTTDDLVLTALHQERDKKPRRKFNLSAFQSAVAVIVAVTVVVGGIGYETHVNHGEPFSTNNATGVSTLSNQTGVSTPNWNSSTLLQGQVIGVGNGHLVVKLPPSSHYSRNGNQTNRDMQIAKDTLMWTNGRLVSYSQTNELHQGDYFTAVVKIQNGDIIAEKIYGPVIQIYGRVTGEVDIPNHRIKVETMVWELGKGGTKQLVSNGNDVTILLDSHTSGTSMSKLNSGQLIQIEGFGSKDKKILATDISLINMQRYH